MNLHLLLLSSRRAVVVVASLFLIYRTRSLTGTVVINAVSEKTVSKMKVEQRKKKLTSRRPSRQFCLSVSWLIVPRVNLK